MNKVTLTESVIWLGPLSYHFQSVF